MNSLAILLASKNNFKYMTHTNAYFLTVNTISVALNFCACATSTPFVLACKHGHWDYIQEDCVVGWRLKSLHKVCP